MVPPPGNARRQVHEFGGPSFTRSGHRRPAHPGRADGYGHRGLFRTSGSDCTGPGYWLEFRSSGELAYRFDDRSRIGIMVTHISNADLGDRNPGTEVLMLSYSTPLSKIFGD